MSEIVGRTWSIQSCNSKWEPEGQPITLTKLWSGTTHRTVGEDAAEELTALRSIDEMDGMVTRLLVTDDVGVTKRVRVDTDVRVEFRATVEQDSEEGRV